MAGHSGTNRMASALRIIVVLCTITSLVEPTFAGDVTDGSGKLAFTAKEDGGYEFDTGILRGRLREASKGLGMSSAVITGFLLDDFGLTARYVCTATGFAAVILFAMWLCYSVFASETALRTTFSYATVKISKENVNDQITERSQLLA